MQQQKKGHSLATEMKKVEQIVNWKKEGSDTSCFSIYNFSLDMAY